MLKFRFLLLGLIIALPALVCADDAADSARPPAPEKPKRPLTDVIPRQPGDDELELFTPKDNSAVAAKAKADGMTWYLAGQVKEARDEYDAARADYRRSIEANPVELPPYQSLVTLAFAQPSQREEAKTYALQAAQQAPGGIDLVRGLAALFVRNNETAQAVSLLDKVLETKPETLTQVNELLLHRDLGLFNQLSGHSDKALEHYRIVFDTLQSEDSPLSPDDRETVLGDTGVTYEEMGKVFLEAKLPDLAVAAFEEAAKFNKGRPGVHSFNLATVYKETGEPQKALDELQKYFDAQLQTKGREAYQLLADLLAETQQTDQLLPKLEEMHGEDLHNVALRYFLAETYQNENQLDEAEKLFKETVGDGNDPRGLVGLAGVYREKGDAKALYDVLRRAIQVVPQPDEDEQELLERMDPDMRAVVKQFGDVQTEIAADQPLMEKLLTVGREKKATGGADFEFVDAYMLAKLAADAGMVDGAKEFYQTAIDLQNDPLPALYRELGLVLTEAQRYAEAAEVFQAALTHTSPRLQSAFIQSYFQYLRSHALEMDGQTDAALEAIREARKLQPDNPGYHFQEAWVHYHAQHFDEAIAEFENILQNYGGIDDEAAKQTVKNSRYSLSAIYVQQGDETKGEEILLEVYRDDPNDTQVNNDLGYLWADQGRKLDEAKAMIAKAIAADPDNAAYLDSMGWVLFKMGDYEAAREHLEKATALPRGEDSTLFDHLADTYEKLGDHDKAVETWKKALELEQADKHPDPKIIDRIKAKLPE